MIFDISSVLLFVVALDVLFMMDVRGTVDYNITLYVRHDSLFTTC
jgi:hypothetical protein